MVAVDAQLAMLAAQCMLTLVAIPPPAAAIAVRSPHSNHGEVAGPLHHQRHSVVPLPAEKKHYSSKGSHDSKSASKKNQERDHSAVSQESSDSENRNLLSESASSLGTEQPHEQRTFQARDLPPRDAMVPDLRPLLKQVLGALGPVLGDLPLVEPVLDILRPILDEILVGVSKTLGARHHHDHYREKIIIDDDSRPFHEHIHARTHFEHTQLSNRESGKRGIGPVRGIIAAVDKNFQVVTFLSADNSSSELNASRGSATAFYLDEVPWLSSSTQSAGNSVMLRVEQANTASDGSGERCATFDPNPPSPSTLKLTRCFVSANNVTEHADQVFSLDPKSNQLQPMSSDNTTSAYQDVRMNARDDDGVTDDVILVFQQAPAIAAEAPPTSSDARYQASLTTVTVTTTATQMESSSIAAADTTPSSTSTGSSSSSSPSPTSQSSPASLDVEVALPSATPSGTESSPENDTSSTPSSSTDSTSQTASGSTAAEVSPSPVSLLFEVKEKWNTVSGSTMTV